MLIGEFCRMTVLTRLLLCLSLVSMLPLGCGPGVPAGARPTKKVSAVVLYKGAPVAGASVTFVETSDKPIIATGITDTQGKTKLKTYVDGDGAVLGSHKVMISKMEAVGGQTVDVDDPKYDPNAPPSTVRYILPQKYSLTTSGLTAEVSASGPSEFTFDLKE